MCMTDSLFRTAETQLYINYTTKIKKKITNRKKILFDNY